MCVTVGRGWRHDLRHANRQSISEYWNYPVAVALFGNPPMIASRWVRIIPVALIMYTISYVDRTNISLALDPKISSMLHDLQDRKSVV